MKNENEKVIDKIIRKRCNKLFEIYIALEKETKDGKDVAGTGVDIVATKNVENA